MLICGKQSSKMQDAMQDKQREVLKKLMRYCAYQERCHKEVKEKILSYGLYGDILEAIVYTLITDNYLNEERFARSFAGGKFRQKAWGRNKIRFELQNRDISDYCIEKGLSEIDDEEYSEKLKQIIEEQFKKYEQLEHILAKDKILKYCTGRGYEIDLVLRCLRQY
jgi:regulatory protein